MTKSDRFVALRFLATALAIVVGTSLCAILAIATGYFQQKFKVEFIQVALFSALIPLTLASDPERRHDVRHPRPKVKYTAALWLLFAASFAAALVFSRRIRTLHVLVPILFPVLTLAAGKWIVTSSGLTIRKTRVGAVGRAAATAVLSVVLLALQFVLSIELWRSGIYDSTLQTVQIALGTLNLSVQLLPFVLYAGFLYLSFTFASDRDEVDLP